MAQFLIILVAVLVALVIGNVINLFVTAHLTATLAKIQLRSMGSVFNSKEMTDFTEEIEDGVITNVERLSAKIENHEKVKHTTSDYDLSDV